MSELVTVIIPTYNRASLITRAIKSVQKQTYQEFEIIVIDDASTDNTERTLAKIKDSRIRYVKHEQRRGGGAARNTGIRIARGNFVAFLDSDDEWLPEKLELQLEYFRNHGVPKLGIVNCHLMHGRNSGSETPNTANKRKPIDKYRPGTGHQLKYLIMVARTACFEDCEFDEELESLQDEDLFIRLAEKWNYTTIPKALVIKHTGGEQISTGSLSRLNGRARFYQKHRKIMTNSYKSLVCFIVGHEYCSVGDMKNGRKWLLRSIAYQPTNKKPIVCLLASGFGARRYRKLRGLHSPH